MTRDELRAQYERARILADGEAVDACGVLLDAVASYLDTPAARPAASSAPDRTFALGLKGERHTFAVEAWQTLTAAQLWPILSDLTGYRVEYLADTVKLDRLGYATVPPALTVGHVPVFTIRSSDGGPLPDNNPTRKD